jgi:hypothetical protein
MFFLSFPRRVAFWIAGPEEAKNLGGAKGLRLIQIRLATSSLEKIFRLGKTNCSQRSIHGSKPSLLFWQ